jgi:hypothetical protein
MKRILAPMAGIAFLLAFSSFFLQGLNAQESRKLDPFDGIGIGVSADVYYTPGNTYEITIEGNTRDVNDLVTKVENGMLKIKYEDWKSKHSKLTIHITSKELEQVSVSGSAKFRAEKAISSDEMGINISGSGSVHLPELKGDELEVKISGSGDCILDKGIADEMDIKISGSGKLHAEHFEVSEFSAAISGSGSCKITVTDELEASLSGSGSVFYHGNPQVNSRASGSGKVRSL